jgi:hypothetical protein
MAGTTDRVSTIAGRLAQITGAQICTAAGKGDKLDALVRDIRTVAASALASDRTPRRGLLGRLLNRG